MASYVNPKGMTLVYGCHRCVLPVEGIFRLWGPIKSKQSDYGSYAHFDKVPGRGVNAIYGDDNGYPLAETLLQFNGFSEVDDLVYMEHIGNGVRLVVIISKKKVLYESLLNSPKIPDVAIMSMVSTGRQFKVVIAGEAQQDEIDDDSYLFPKHLIKELVYERSSVLADAKPNNKYVRLNPLVKAVEKGRVVPVTRFNIFATAVLLLAASFVYDEFLSGKKIEPVAVVKTDKYESYRAALNSYSPAGNVMAGLALIMECDLLSGWKTTRLSMNATNLYVDLENNGGRHDALEAWGKMSNKPVRTVKNTTQVYAPLVTKPREFGNVIYRVDEVVQHLRNTVIVVNAGELTLEESSNRSGIVTRGVSLTVDNALPQEIAYIAHSLADLPITLVGLEITRNGKLYGASIKLNILGLGKVDRT